MSDRPASNDPSVDTSTRTRLEESLRLADENEQAAANAFLTESRPSLVAGKTLAWDGFWKKLAGGLDAMLWSWFGGAVDVARAQEDDRAQRRARRRASDVVKSHQTGPVSPGSDPPSTP